MKKFQINGVKQILFTLLAMLVSLPAFSQDIEVANSDGITIYYNWENNNTELSVTSHPSDFYLGKVVIPETVTYDGKSYPVTSIGEGAFEDCEELTSIIIPNGVISIGEGAFYYCIGLTSIVVEKNNPVYDSRENCNAIIATETNELIAGCKNSIIPNSVTSIGEYAFGGCTGLNSIDIPNSVSSIGEGAFGDCTGLTSIEIPNSVTSIGEGAFSFCTGLTSIEIPNSVTSIGGRTFSRCKGLTSIEIPNSVTSIGEDAFENCTGLTSIEIPNSVTSIGEYAFCGSGLTSVIIPNNVTSIGKYAFGFCSELQYIAIKEGVKNIDEDAFTSSEKVLDVVCFSKNAEGNNSWVQNFHRTLHVPIEALEAYESTEPWCNSFQMILGEDLRDDNCNTFRYRFNNDDKTASIEKFVPLSSDVQIPTRVAYKGVEYRVTGIGKSAFYYCTGLTSVTIPEGIQSIDEEAFLHCSGLTSVNVPNSVTQVGHAAFWACDLQDPVYNDKYFFFLDGSYQGECVIPAGIEVIAPEAFYNCQSLTSVSVPSSVTTIGKYAFYYCTGLSSVTIPEGIQSIDEGAFGLCTGLTSVTSLNTTPPVIESTTFYTTKYATLYVPTGCKAIYSSSPYWKDFAKIEEIDVTNISIIIPEEEHSRSMYQLNGIKANDGNLGRGIYIQNGKKVLVK